MSYRVVVTREDGAWLADAPDLAGAHTYARTLPALDKAVREVVVLAADLPDDAMPDLELEYEYRTGDPELDAATAEIRELRARVDELSTLAAERVAVKRLEPTGETPAMLRSKGSFRGVHRPV